MAQHGAGTGGEDGRNPPAVPRHDRMTDREDAAVDDVEAARREPVVHGAAAEPEARQLPAGDHSVLAGRQRREGGVHHSIAMPRWCRARRHGSARNRTNSAQELPKREG
jgi:hypothetical protein